MVRRDSRRAPRQADLQGAAAPVCGGRGREHLSGRLRPGGNPLRDLSPLDAAGPPDAFRFVSHVLRGGPQGGSRSGVKHRGRLAWRRSRTTGRPPATSWPGASPTAGERSGSTKSPPRAAVTRSVRTRAMPRSTLKFADLDAELARFRPNARVAKRPSHPLRQESSGHDDGTRKRSLSTRRVDNNGAHQRSIFVAEIRKACANGVARPGVRLPAGPVFDERADFCRCACAGVSVLVDEAGDETAGKSRKESNSAGGNGSTEDASSSARLSGAGRRPPPLRLFPEEDAA